MTIKKCPKCGWQPSEITHYTSSDKRFHDEIECYDCGLHTGRCDTHDDAVAKWNELTEMKDADKQMP